MNSWQMICFFLYFGDIYATIIPNISLFNKKWISDNMIVKNMIYNMEITDTNNLGFGVGRIKDIVVFVKGAVGGDFAQVRIIKVNKSYCVGRAEKILIPSPNRCSGNKCPIDSRCGGCAFRGLSYRYELELKRSFVTNAFIKHGMRHIKVLDTLSTGKTDRYRNKAQYPVGVSAEGGYDIGFYAARSHRIINSADCALQPKIFNEIVEFVRIFMTEKKIPAYCEKTHTGLVRHLYFRIGERTGEVMVCLVLNGTNFPFADEFCTSLTRIFPSVVSIMINENRERTNVVLGESFSCIYGKEYIDDILCDIRLKIPPASFYQVNRDGAELLYRKAAELAAFRGDEVLLDLFCGIGSIGLSMAKSVKEVIGIEIVPEAVEYANKNAADNGIGNAKFYCGDASNVAELLALAEQTRGSEISPDVIVVDPPRKGCSPELIDHIAELSPDRVLYISCNPGTLARDAERFEKHGYLCSDVIPVDLFPRTGHVECVTLMSKVEK